ncbi:TetR family transcriptional regulator [Chitinophaga niastensis]|uniref:TetR family transcriptional regulator n=1 Tax=Chitinophaga niastensis TaxID=536980 RepID=A0A2P8HJM5_CHINA|nr:TetR/AcrR family transcriptional regulator [Chitinophaga niastensis]PSL46405.1 TetR family transcriptional regulator [Chitinophaga niastensis]
MSGRPKIFDDQEVIGKATELFWRQGYEATSTEDLLAAMGIGKGSFYLAFKGGKKELYEKVLEQFNEKAITRSKKELAASKDPIEFIRNFFRSIVTSPKKIHQKGCFFGNAIAELSNTDILLMRKAANHLKELEELFHDALTIAQKNGQLKNQQDPALLARTLLSNWNGLGITRRIYPDNEILSELIEMQLKILE